MRLRGTWQLRGCSSRQPRTDNEKIGSRPQTDERSPAPLTVYRRLSKRVLAISWSFFVSSGLFCISFFHFPSVCGHFVAPHWAMWLSNKKCKHSHHTGFLGPHEPFGHLGPHTLKSSFFLYRVLILTPNNRASHVNVSLSAHWNWQKHDLSEN